MGGDRLTSELTTAQFSVIPLKFSDLLDLVKTLQFQSINVVIMQ